MAILRFLVGNIPESGFLGASSWCGQGQTPKAVDIEGRVSNSLRNLGFWATASLARRAWFLCSEHSKLPEACLPV